MTRPAHVILNALFLDPGASGGPETYLREIAEALHDQYPALDLTVVTTVSGAEALRRSGWASWADVVALPCEDGQRLRRQWAEQVLLPRLARRAGADLIHSIASVAPVRPGIRSVVTLHDVTFIVHRTFGRITTWGMTRLIKRAARKADVLIAISAAARDQICEVLGLDPRRFVVVPHGRGRQAVDASLSESAARSKFGLGDTPVVLCVGAKRPHKNQEVLIQALASIEGVVLVLVGHAEPYEQRLRGLATATGVADRVRFIGYLPDGELEALWSLAACAAFPTLAEGFGLPLIEALDRGVAIAASDIPVLREAGGDVPHWFDPRDPSSAVAAIRLALADESVVSTGPAQAGRFSWSEAARGTMAAYERALAK